MSIRLSNFCVKCETWFLIAGLRITDFNTSTLQPLTFGMPASGGRLIKVQASSVFRALFGVCCTACLRKLSDHCSAKMEGQEIVQAALTALSHGSVEGENKNIGDNNFFLIFIF